MTGGFISGAHVVNASRLAYWLGKLVDVPQKSEKMASSKLTLYVFLFFLHTGTFLLF